jgi:hypothetical protein
MSARTRRRDHRPRFDSVCPNPADCGRYLHPQLVEGDCCECCGEEIKALRYVAREHTAAGRWGVYDRKSSAWPAFAGGRRVANMSTREAAEHDAAWLNEQVTTDTAPKGS